MDTHRNLIDTDAHWWINNFGHSEYIIAKAIEYEGRLVGR